MASCTWAMVASSTSKGAGVWAGSSHAASRKQARGRITRSLYDGRTVTAFRCFLLAFALAAHAQDHNSWRDYGGAADSAQYSALTQINRSNVRRLEPAWSYPTGDGQKYSFNPVMADGMLYVLAKHNSIVALDAGTGKEI